MALVIIVLIHVVGGALLLRLDLNNAPSLYFPDQAPATVLERELRQLKTLCDGRPGACNLIATLHAQADAELPPEPGSHVKRHV